MWELDYSSVCVAVLSPWAPTHPLDHHCLDVRLGRLWVVAPKSLLTHSDTNLEHVHRSFERQGLPHVDQSTSGLTGVGVFAATPGGPDTLG